MDSLGLPVSFGKNSSSLPPKPNSSMAASTSSTVSLPPPRGEPGRGRGPRGMVGGGKRGRGRRHAESNRQDVQQQVNGWNMAPDERSLNEGVKRPLTSANLIQPRADASRGFRGGRGIAGHIVAQESGRGGGHAAGQETESPRGFFKESFCEDPWAPLNRLARDKGHR